MRHGCRVPHSAKRADGDGWDCRSFSIYTSEQTPPHDNEPAVHDDAPHDDLHDRRRRGRVRVERTLTMTRTRPSPRRRDFFWLFTENREE